MWQVAGRREQLPRLPDGAERTTFFLDYVCCTRVRGSVTIVGERPPARSPYIGQEGDSLVVVCEDNDF